jgi:hypothetical protein
MNTSKLVSRLLVAISVTAALPAYATLHDRGGGLLYDDVLNVTWLQDANYAKTSGYDSDGQMNWNEASTWASSLVYHDSVRNVDYSDWRLPAMVDTGTPGANFAYSGTDAGFNVLTYDVGTKIVYSEMAYMYYANLGLKAQYSPAGIEQSDFGIHGDGTWSYSGQNDVGLVKNLQDGTYWTGLEYGPKSSSPYAPDHDGAWFFSPRFGFQDYDAKTTGLYGWAVRDGDVVAAVPEPETYAMLLAGLGMVGAMARRQRR